MSIFDVDFPELYRRHLCRHSEFGINVLHLIAVVGIYLSLIGIAVALPSGRWIVSGVLVAYFAVLARNIPVRLWIASVVFILLLLGLFLSLPSVPVWIHFGMLFVWHKFQNWNHTIYHKHHDMEEFREKYRKGLALFFLLSVYELPILLNYLAFDRASWSEPRAAVRE